MVSLLWIQTENKAKKLEIQGKTQGKEYQQTGCRTHCNTHITWYSIDGLMSTEQYIERIVKVQERNFSIRIMRMFNGCFISISEGDQHRIGSLNVSLHRDVGASTAKVIPSKYDSLFLSMISERLASLTNGICITSLYTKKALDLNAMKTIMGMVIDVASEQNGSA